MMVKGPTPIQSSFLVSISGWEVFCDRVQHGIQEDSRGWGTTLERGLLVQAKGIVHLPWDGILIGSLLKMEVSSCVCSGISSRKRRKHREPVRSFELASPVPQQGTEQRSEYHRYGGGGLNPILDCPIHQRQMKAADQ